MLHVQFLSRTTPGIYQIKIDIAKKEKRIKYLIGLFSACNIGLQLSYIRENMLQSHELQIVRHSYSVKRVQNSRGFVRPRKLPCEDED